MRFGLKSQFTICKGATLAARFTGSAWRESFTVGVLMNAKGLVELIVLNLGLSVGVLTTQVKITPSFSHFSYPHLPPHASSSSTYPLSGVQHVRGDGSRHNRSHHTSRPPYLSATPRYAHHPQGELQLSDICARPKDWHGYPFCLFYFSFYSFIFFFYCNVHCVTFAKTIGTKENPTMVKAIFMNEINDRPSSYFFQLSNKLRNDVPFFKDKASKVKFKN
jgi:Kef-type K+ transport system membrane component KefB